MRHTFGDSLIVREWALFCALCAMVGMYDVAGRGSQRWEESDNVRNAAEVDGSTSEVATRTARRDSEHQHCKLELPLAVHTSMSSRAMSLVTTSAGSMTSWKTSAHSPSDICAQPSTSTLATIESQTHRQSRRSRKMDVMSGAPRWSVRRSISSPCVNVSRQCCEVRNQSLIETQ